MKNKHRGYVFLFNDKNQTMDAHRTLADGTLAEDDIDVVHLKYLFKYADIRPDRESVHAVVMFPNPVYHTNKRLLFEYLEFLRNTFGAKAAYGTQTPGGYLVHYTYVSPKVYFDQNILDFVRDKNELDAYNAIRIGEHDNTIKSDEYLKHLNESSGDIYGPVDLQAISDTLKREETR